jgi:hypothetical protein
MDISVEVSNSIFDFDGFFAIDTIDIARIFDRAHEEVLWITKRNIEQGYELDLYSYAFVSYIESFQSGEPSYIITSEKECNLLSFLSESFLPQRTGIGLEYQRKLHSMYGGYLDVRTPFGIIDILSEDTIIEIRKFEGYVKSLGRLKFFDTYFPGRKKIYATYGYEINLNVTKEEVFRVFRSHGIDVLLLEAKIDVIVKDTQDNILFDLNNISYN